MGHLRAFFFPSFRSDDVLDNARRRLVHHSWVSLCGDPGLYSLAIRIHCIVIHGPNEAGAEADSHRVVGGRLLFHALHAI